MLEGNLYKLKGASIADVKAWRDEDNMTLMHFALCDEDASLQAFLYLVNILSLADVSAGGSCFSPLSFAAACGDQATQLSMIKSLLQMKVYPATLAAALTQKDRDGRTPHTVALKFGRTEMASLLKQLEVRARNAVPLPIIMGRAVLLHTASFDIRFHLGHVSLCAVPSLWPLFTFQLGSRQRGQGVQTMRPIVHILPQKAPLPSMWPCGL